MLLSSTLTSTGSQGQAVSVLDNASGAGIIPSLILQLVDKARVSNDVYITAADIDPMYIGQLEKRKAAGSERWTSVDIQQVDLQVSLYFNS